VSRELKVIKAPRVIKDIRDRPDLAAHKALTAKPVQPDHKDRPASTEIPALRVLRVLPALRVYRDRKVHLV
jgi:hypothetical protein